MPARPEYYLVLIEKARQDCDAAADLAKNDRIAIEVIGFHVQQAVEKSLKAVLEFRGVSYALTHDLLALLDLLGMPGPIERDDANLLNQFAVRFRYDLLPVTQAQPQLDPSRTARLAEDAIAWARVQIRKG